MRRPAAIASVWLATLFVAAWSYVATMGEAAATLGRDRYRYRIALEGQLARAAKARPGVLWLGDSTILGLRDVSYPQLVHGAAPGVPYQVTGFVGSDFCTYYPFVAALLERTRPLVLVLVAHLRLFDDPQRRGANGAATRKDLLSLVPTSELGCAVRLPFGTCGVTLPRLLLARSLRWDAVERALLVVDGARALVSEARLDSSGARPSSLQAGLDEARRALRGSDVPIASDHPMVRLMEATVALARAVGVRVVVVGTPIPFEAMQRTVGYDPAVYRTRFETLRAAVEQADGVFVDLHEELSTAQFVDRVGHFAKEGAEVLAERLRPIVAAEVQRAQRDRWFQALAAARESAMSRGGVGKSGTRD